MTEVCQVIISYPIFLIAISIFAFYAIFSVLSQVRDYAIDCMCEYVEKQDKREKARKIKNGKRQNLDEMEDTEQRE